MRTVTVTLNITEPAPVKGVKGDKAQAAPFARYTSQERRVDSSPGFAVRFPEEWRLLNQFAADIGAVLDRG